MVDDLQPPVEPMRVASIGQWPAGDDWRFEPKADGYRGLAFHQGERVFLQSRAGRNLARYFPDLVQAITNSLPPRSVVDGEIVVLAGDRIDFAALQRRITVGVDPAYPAYLIAFDLLQHPDHGVILSEPLSVRRDLLGGLLADATPAIALSPQSADVAVAEEWMTTDWTAAGFEGVVVKAAAGRYKPGGTGWWKRASPRRSTSSSPESPELSTDRTPCCSGDTKPGACPTSAARPPFRPRPVRRSPSFSPGAASPCPCPIRAGPRPCRWGPAIGCLLAAVAVV